MAILVRLGIVGALAFGTNVPLGYWREGYRRLSVPWFVAIHASIPAIVAARLLLDVRWFWIPLFIFLAVIGQIIGGNRRKGRSECRPPASDRPA